MQDLVEKLSKMNKEPSLSKENQNTLIINGLMSFNLDEHLVNLFGWGMLHETYNQIISNILFLTNHTKNNPLNNKKWSGDILKSYLLAEKSSQMTEEEKRKSWIDRLRGR